MHTGLLHRVGKYLLGYDAVESKNRRQAPTGRLRSEDKAGRKGRRPEPEARDGQDRPPTRDAQKPAGRSTKKKTD